ncbi:MAG: uracil phosphoribosyltransferase [Clostridia bacterium]
MKAPIILEHPLIQHKLSILRDKATGVKEFREVIAEISMLMCYEATRDMPLKEVEIETPFAITKTKVIAGKKLAVVPILRAGLGMIDGIIELMPTVKVGHIGLYRDPTTLDPVEYYCKMPADIADRDALVLEPALATGGSACAAIDILRNNTQKNIKLMCIIASKQGIKKVQERYPEIDIYCAAIDDGLNDNSYITPGLGDVGDRIFGTK